MIIIYQTDSYDAGYRVKGLFFHACSKSATVFAFCIECHRIITQNSIHIELEKNFTDLHLAFSWNEILFHSASWELES